MKLSAKITRNRIAATLRWIGLAAVNDRAESASATSLASTSLERFETAAKWAAKRKSGQSR